MKTLHLYLTREILATLLMTVAVFTFVLLLGNALKEILLLLINREATLGMVLQAFALLVPWVLAFALPMGMLTATLLVFGRFSADQELTAVRSSGVSLVALITPILLLSLFLCGVSAVINMEIAPRCRVAYKKIIDGMKAKMSVRLVSEGKFIPLPGPNGTNYIFYIGKSDGTNLQNILVWEIDAQQKQVSETVAKRGTIGIIDQKLTLHLEEIRHDLFAEGEVVSPVSSSIDFPIDSKSSQATAQKPSLSDMTFLQLLAELQSLETLFSAPEVAGQGSDAMRQRLAQLRSRQRDLTMPVRVQIHRQVAFSFACFGFTLVGIPLGIRAHRRETNAGIAMALVLVLIYYSFVILGQSLETHAELAPHLIIWLPNFVFQAVGAVMLWRANRGT